QPQAVVAAGWYADPSGRHQSRFWDGQAWTERVASGDATLSSSPPPAPAQRDPDHEPSSRYQPTHVVPTAGLSAWSAPDPSTPPSTTLDPALDVRLLERHGDWARVQCSNGWTCWVDGNALIETGPAVGRPA